MPASLASATVPLKANVAAARVRAYAATDVIDWPG
jgi:hypothetical protein